MSERLERVERFEELREGMVMVMQPCAWCSGKHRAMVMGVAPTGQGRFVDGSVGTRGLRRYATPEPRCIPAGGYCVTEASVAEGRVFRVLDGLEEPSTETAAASGTTRRTPQKERAR